MDAQERRQGVAKYLEQAQEPVSATVLAKKFSVSRQIIVGDVALLRAGGMEISATPRGYVLPAPSTGKLYTIACRHNTVEMEQELNAIVDQGCTVVDVIVEHPVYGQITGPLQISSRYESTQFVFLIARQAAAPLSALTDGIHLHTIQCPDDAAFERVKAALREQGFLLEN